MSDNQNDNERCQSGNDDQQSYPVLHFSALNSGFNNNKQLDDTQQLFNVAKRHKFVVVPANLPDSTLDFPVTDTIAISQESKGLKSVASSPAGFPIPAIVSPTKPSNISYHY